MKIGLFGGTFNPVHNGHIQVAIDTQSHISLDQVVFIPLAVPPHKSSVNLVNASDRLSMLKLAVDEHPELAVSELELNRKGISYTIDTIMSY